MTNGTATPDRSFVDRTSQAFRSGEATLEPQDCPECGGWREWYVNEDGSREAVCPQCPWFCVVIH